MITSFNKPVQCKLNHFGVISVSGDARHQFLQGQVSIDVNKVADNSSKLAAYCNPKGRMFASLFLHNQDDMLHIILPQKICEHTLTKLKKYAAFFKVELTDNSNNMQIIASVDATNYFNKTLNTQTQELPKFKLVSKQESSSSFKNQEESSIDEVDTNTFDIICIYNRIPFIFKESIEQFLPANLNMQADYGIDFDKGCYLGQEIIARMKYLGKVKKHMYHLTLDTSKLQSSINLAELDLAPATTIYEIIELGSDTTKAPNPCGHIVQAKNDNGIIHILAIVPDKMSEYTITVNTELKLILEPK